MALFLRVVASIASVLVILGFLMFAVEQGNKGSQQQQAKINKALVAPSPTPREEFLRERENGAFREYIDDANDVLLAPFASIVDSDDLWVQRLVPGGLALLLYGFGGLMLANALPKPRHDVGDWRQGEAT